MNAQKLSMKKLATVFGILLFGTIGWFLLCKKDRTIDFPKNQEGKAVVLEYNDDFSRVNVGKSVASLTKYEDGFFGAFYGYMYYFNSKNGTVEDVAAPKGFYGISDIRFFDKDESSIWDVTGLYYDCNSDLLYVANYKGHNILVCTIDNEEEIPTLSVKDVYTFEGMKSPENVYSRNGIIAVADYDGNALWILSESGELIKQVDVELAHGVAISSDAIFVTSLMDRKIYKYSYGGELICSVGNLAFEGKDSFMWPTGLDVSDNELIVTDAHTCRICTYDFDLNYISSIGGFGPSDNALNFPYCAIYVDDSLYVADVFNERIIIIGNDGRINKVWGDAIENIDMNVVFHQTSDIPYTYGVTDEINSQLINPYINSDVVLGYNSLWLDNGNQNVQIVTTDYQCNEGIFEANLPRLDQMFSIWVKQFELDDEVYYIIGSPELNSQCYVYNETKNIFFIPFFLNNNPIWNVDGDWYCEVDENKVFADIIEPSKEAQSEYLELLNSGVDKKNAYIKAFLKYYNTIYQRTLVTEMDEEAFSSWIETFFSSENGQRFWNNYQKNPENVYNATMEYYEATQYGGTHLCELFMVRMFGEMAP